MPFDHAQTVAVIGAGIAGASVARTLTLAGHSVHVFDKSRGPGGRLATRRVEWVDHHGNAQLTRLDHGAVGVMARAPAFQSFVDQALDAGWLARWAPTLSADSVPLEFIDRMLLPVPDMPALCRHLLQGVASTWSMAVDSLQHGPLGWGVHSNGAHHPVPFDAVVLALPPAQAAPLLKPHRLDWAQRASVVPMDPCWTLMGIAEAPTSLLIWDVARPPSGPLEWVLRNATRPGRARVAEQEHWVVHARADWSRHHLEQPATWVMMQMQSALSDWLGQPVNWYHCVVHRWRYALPKAHGVAADNSNWWDDALNLGVCGDFFGNSGVEGAWLSAQLLTAAMRNTPSVPGG